MAFSSDAFSSRKRHMLKLLFPSEGVPLNDTFKRETKERLFRSIFNLFNRRNFDWIHSFIQGTAGTVLYSIMYNICIIIVLANNVEVRTYASVVEGEKGI